MNYRKAGVTLVFAAAALGLSACASSDSRAEPSTPSATVSAYFRAVDRADGAELCSFLAPAAQREITQLQGSPCPQAMAQEAKRLPESLNGYKIVGETVTGNTATVRVTGLGDEKVKLRRDGGGWRIVDAPGLGL